MSTPKINPEKIIQSMDDFVDKVPLRSPGAFGRIYQAVIKSTRQQVLIKEPIDNDSSVINALITEYNILMKCSHPSIPLVVGFYHPKNSQKYALVLPFYKHGSLENLLHNSKKDIGPNLKLQIVLGIVDALDYLHSNNIAHRDIKPDNIVLDINDHPYLVDFGISKEYVEKMSTAIGTFDYVAPELFGSEPYDNKADIYSFGLVVNEIYSRQKTFRGLSREQIIMKKLNGDVHADPKIPGFLRGFIERCLAFDASTRPACSEILCAIKNYIQNELDDNTTLLAYTKELYNGRKIKFCFNIPRQIIILPKTTDEWKEDMEAPIDWNEFKKVFKPTDKKVVLIMTIGNHQSGKSTFIRTITGNYGFYTGVGSESTTPGLIIDGPYKPSFLVNRIYDINFRSIFENVSISDDVLFYFLDTQGIGDKTYRDLAFILDKIYSIFSSCSTFCISLPNMSSPLIELEMVFKIMRRTQLILSSPTSYTSMMMLVKEYQLFTNLADSDFESLSDFQEIFQKEYWRLHKDTVEFYFSKYISIYPLGDAVKAQIKYIHSVWFAFYNLLTQLSGRTLFSSNEIVNRLDFLTALLFGKGFLSIKKRLFDEPDKKILEKITKFPSFSEVKEPISSILKCCACFTNIYANEIFEIVSSSASSNSDVKELYKQIQQTSTVLISVYLPYFISKFNITLSDFWQYSIEITKDSESFNKSNSDFYKKHMKQENDAIKYNTVIAISNGIVAGSLAAIPIAGWVVGPLFGGAVNLAYFLYFKVQQKIRENIMNKLFPTIFPYIWEKEMTKLKPSIYDMSKIGQIGNKNDQLILFYEQNNNNSSLIFSSLIGYIINSNDQKISLLFKKVPIKSLMERYKRFGKIHQSKLENKNVHILYLKGYSQSQIDEICFKQENKPILVSSLVDGQKPEIRPNNNCHSSYLFYLSTEHYRYYVIQKGIFLNSLNDQSANSVKEKLNLKSTKIIFLSAPDYNFFDYGPLIQGQLKYGCRLVLQDNSLI